MNKQSRKSFLERSKTFIYRVEDSILVGLLLLMIIMAVLQIILRNLFGGGIVWSEVLVRILVLWVGLIGAMVASRQGQHITLDILSRYLKPKQKQWVGLITQLFTATVCALLTYHAYRFVAMEYLDGTLAFAQVPSWLCQSILPIAFGVIALRALLQAAGTSRKLLSQAREH